MENNIYDKMKMRSEVERISFWLDFSFCLSDEFQLDPFCNLLSFSIFVPAFLFALFLPVLKIDIKPNFLYYDRFLVTFVNDKGKTCNQYNLTDCNYIYKDNAKILLCSENV